MERKLDQLFRFLKKFRAEELPEVLENAFYRNFWKDIKNFALKRKINLTNSRNVVMICYNLYKAQEPTNADIQKVLWYLQFSDVLCHSNVIWKCAALVDRIGQFPSDLEDLKRKITQSYRCEARDVEMVMTLKEDLIWLMVIEKKITKKGIKFGKPFFVVINVSLDKQYVFFCPAFKNDSSNEVNHLMLISIALGYEKYREVSFEGKDVKSLFGMIKRHKTEQNQIAVFQPKKVLMEDNILDFTQGRARLNYANQVLPPGLTNLSEFTVHSRIEWRGDMPLCRRCLGFTELRIRTKGRSSSVETVLRELIALGFVSIPVPHYITRLPYLNRNVVQIKSIDETRHSQGSNFDDEM
ncbi:uncharacterized protein [Halyomorpha halys]|uniref:uncharacterized protein n=1 Tax=Halyomorpha halys TaxID=286706 RepID=UPI0006D52624|nr:uncharacterized protein LOC106687491 [Halyomorpha halys]